MLTRHISTGEQLHIFDNVFSIKNILDFESFANHALYKLIEVYGSQNTISTNARFFGSTLTNETLQGLNILPSLPEEISSLIKDLQIERAWILSSNHSTTYNYHIDSAYGYGSITVLCYLNSFWHPEWGGETLYCNKYGEPEVAIACKPNRVVVFPSTVLHKPSPTTIDAPYRFTFTATFRE